MDQAMNPRRQASTIAVTVLLAVSWLLASVAVAQEDEDPAVRGVLFFSPTCGHCEYVINSVLPPLFEENGGAAELFYDATLENAGIPFYLLDNGTLQMLLVDVSVEAGAALFLGATDRYGIDSNGVPRMIIDDEVYIGSADIPEALSKYVADGLTGDGIDWPSLQGVEAALASVARTVATTTTSGSGQETTTTTGSGGVLPVQDTLADRFGRDPVGNTLAVIVLVGMLASFGGVAVRWRRPHDRRNPDWAILAVAVIGVGAAAYLGYVEISGVEAVCGPVGDCNTVQQSEYARLFGVIPVGVLGLVGYVVVVGAWLVARTDRGPWSDYARVGLFAGTVGGVALSAYLTFLEPFVIGATCAWCLTSAVAITILMWLAVGPATDAWSKLRSQSERSATPVRA
jgi:uncharacterized membrane protein